MKELEKLKKKALQDLEQLRIQKLQALKEPIEFMNKLDQENVFPKRQNVPNVPKINFEFYDTYINGYLNDISLTKLTKL